MAAGAGRMIVLVSSDGQRFQLPEAAASLSGLIRGMLEEGRVTDDGVKLPNVAAVPLDKVVEYCNKHVTRTATDAMDAWDAEFIAVDQAVLFDIINAADYLDIKSLVDLAAQRAADMIKGRTPDQIREIFGLEDDLTPEMKYEIRRDSPWVFDTDNNNQ